MMIPHAPLFAVLIPAISALSLYAFKRYLEEHVKWIATISASTSILFVLSMVPRLLAGETIVYEYAWIPSLTPSLTFGFLVDMVSFPIALIFSIVSTLSCLYSIKCMEGEPGQVGYYTNLLLFMSGMIGVVLSSNLLQFYLFWELMLIPSYLLIAFWGTSERKLAIGFKYFIFTHVGALCMLLGILLIYAFTDPHTFDLTLLSQAATNIPQNLVPAIFILLLIGFTVKMAVFPVHTWLPDAHAEAPTPISAMLSGIMIKCGAYAVARILPTAFGETMIQASDSLAIIGIVTMIYGGLMALAQTDIKRLLAYSSISQMGYVFFGLGVASAAGFTGALFHVFNHAICKALLFMGAGIIIHQTHTRDLRQLGGLAGKMPLTCIVSLIGALSLAGTPPLNGFWSEWIIFSGGINAGKILLTTVAVISTVITAGYYLWFIWRVFFGETPREMEDVEEGSLLILAPALILAIMAIIVGIWPEPVLQFLILAGEYLANLI